MLTKMRAAALTAFVCTAMAASPASANLLANGSFEDTTNFVDQGSDTMVLSPPSAALTGWTVTSRDLAWIGPTNPFSLTASNGSYFLDLTSYSDPNPYGGVTQNIATGLGAQYTLSFDLGGSTDWGVPNSLRACAGATCSDFTITASGPNQWAGESLNFTGTGGLMAISLTGLSGTYYIGLDNVSVDNISAPPAVPEPLTVSLFGAGVAGIAAIRRRKKAKQA